MSHQPVLSASQQCDQPQCTQPLVASGVQYIAQPLQYSQVQYVPVQSSQYVQAAPAQQSIKGESRVEYIPYETRHYEYDQVERVEYEQVPRQVVQYETVERKVIESIPREKVITEYQTIEYQKEYVPRTVYDTVEEQVPVTRTEYVPVVTTEYVAQPKTEYITQSRQVSRIEYDEVEYQVQRPQVQYVQAQPQTQLVQSQIQYVQPQQLYTSQVVQQPVYQSSIRPIAQHLTYDQVQQQLQASRSRQEQQAQSVHQSQQQE